MGSFVQSRVGLLDVAAPDHVFEATPDLALVKNYVIYDHSNVWLLFWAGMGDREGHNKSIGHFCASGLHHLCPQQLTLCILRRASETDLRSTVCPSEQVGLAISDS